MSGRDDFADLRAAQAVADSTFHRDKLLLCVCVSLPFSLSLSLSLFLSRPPAVFAGPWYTPSLSFLPQRFHPAGSPPVKRTIHYTHAYTSPRTRARARTHTSTRPHAIDTTPESL